MKYKQKVEIEIEFEAGDIAEWKDPQTGEKIWAVVTKAEENYLHGMAFYDNRGYAVPHNVTLIMTEKYVGRVRKVPKSEWSEW